MLRDADEQEDGRSVSDTLDTTVEHAFTAIYQNHAWGRGAGSGEGSHPDRAQDYISLIEQFIRERAIKSVVDLGCGDWQFSRLIDWSGVDYTGIDVVPGVIDELNASFARNGVRFIHGNVAACNLPKADLVISKDVLQHLPNQMVIQVLKRLRHFKYAILTNDRRQYHHPALWNLWNWWPVDITAPNWDIPPGKY